MLVFIKRFKQKSLPHFTVQHLNVNLNITRFIFCPLISPQSMFMCHLNPIFEFARLHYGQKGFPLDALVVSHISDMQIGRLIVYSTLPTECK